MILDRTGREIHPAADLFPLVSGKKYVGIVMGEGASRFAYAEIIESDEHPGFAWVSTMDMGIGRPVRFDAVKLVLERMGFDWQLASWNVEDANPRQATPPKLPEADARPSCDDGEQALDEHSEDPLALVYMIRQGEDGPIKIGTSTDVPSRLRALQTANPFPLRLLATMRGSEKVEFALHRRFAQLRLTGEWFRPEPELLKFIADISAASAGGFQ